MKRKEGPYFLIFLLLVALFTLTKVLLQDVLGAEWSSCLTVWGIVTAVMIEFIYSANDGFFWYNAGVHYVGMHSFLLLLTAAWIRLFKKTGKVLSCHGGIDTLHLCSRTGPLDKVSFLCRVLLCTLGEADSFYQEYLNRIETIENSEADVALTPYVNRPRILQVSELGEFPGEGDNSAMAQWHHKNSITCIAQDSE